MKPANVTCHWNLSPYQFSIAVRIFLVLHLITELLKRFLEGSLPLKMISLKVTKLMTININSYCFCPSFHSLFKSKVLPTNQWPTKAILIGDHFHLVTKKMVKVKLNKISNVKTLRQSKANLSHIHRAEARWILYKPVLQLTWRIWIKYS